MDQVAAETYLIQPAVIPRFLSRSLDQTEIDSAKDHMEGTLLPKMHENPFGPTLLIDLTSGKQVLGELLITAGMKLNESECFMLAGETRINEIHPDVRVKLEQIQDHLADQDIDPSRRSDQFSHALCLEDQRPCKPTSSGRGNSAAR